MLFDTILLNLNNGVNSILKNKEKREPLRGMFPLLGTVIHASSMLGLDKPHVVNDLASLKHTCYTAVAEKKCKQQNTHA